MYINQIEFFLPYIHLDLFLIISSEQQHFVRTNFWKFCQNSQHPQKLIVAFSLETVKKL